MLTLDNIVALLTLTGLEIILGIDNIVFIAILCARLPPEQRNRARLVGLSLAMFMRIGLLLTISAIMRLDKHVLFHLGSPIDHDFTGKDLVLIAGGLFLLVKATLEIHHKIEGGSGSPSQREGGGGRATSPGATSAAVGSPSTSAPHALLQPASRSPSFSSVILQILLIDLVFSLDSVITAVGMARKVEIMIIAVVISVVVMLVFSGMVSRLIEKHPTLKMLALSFLMLIGIMLLADGCGRHIERGYIYFAMGFSLTVELLNIRVRARHQHA